LHCIVAYSEKHSNLEASRHPANKHLYSLTARYCTYLDCSVRATRCSLSTHICGLDQCPSHISLLWLRLDTKRKRRTGPSEPPVHSQLPCSPLTSRLSNLACPFIHSAHSRPPHPRLLGRFSLLLLSHLPPFQSLVCAQSALRLLVILVLWALCRSRKPILFTSRTFEYYQLRERVERGLARCYWFAIGSPQIPRW
jgi:hypothetical protein